MVLDNLQVEVDIVAERISNLERQLEREKIRRDQDMIAQFEVDEQIRKRVFRNQYGYDERMDMLQDQEDRHYWADDYV